MRNKKKIKLDGKEVIEFSFVRQKRQLNYWVGQLEVSEKVTGMLRGFKGK